MSEPHRGDIIDVALSGNFTWLHIVPFIHSEDFIPLGFTKRTQRPLNLKYASFSTTFIETCPRKFFFMHS
jgi:hypothetical protein